MPNVKMPNGDIVAFPDDMPKEQIKSLIASKFPDLAQPKKQEEQEEQADTPKKEHGTPEIIDAVNTAANFVNPVGWANRLGQVTGEFLGKNGPDMAKGILESGANAVTAPMRAMTGELRMTDDTGRTSPQAIEEAFNMATWVTPSSPAQGTLPKIASDWRKMHPQPVTEGQRVAESASRLGVELPRAVTSDNATVQNVGKKLSQTPIVGTPLRDASKKATEQLDDAVKVVQDDLGTGSIEVAGNKIQQDMAKFTGMEEPAALRELYTKVDNLVDPNVRIQMSTTAKTAADIVKSRAAADATESKAVERLRAALMNREGKSYAELKTLREDFRAIKSNKGLMDNFGMNERDVNRLYDALSADLKASTKAAGGDEALAAFTEANNRAAMFARDKEVLKSVLGKGADEKVATNLAALASDSSRSNVKGLMLVKSKVSKETWDELASSVIEDLARNPTNGQFTPDKFTTKWNKLSDSGKKLLFAPEQRQALEDIAKVSSRFKQLNEFANPSGTGGMTALLAGGGTAIYGAIMDPTVLAGTVLTAATGRGISSYLSKPASAKAVAEYVKAYEMAAKVPGQMAQNQLATKAMKLAMIAANNNERMASNLAARMASVQQTAADEQNNEGDGNPIGNPEAAKADQQFNDAYLQGRAF